MKTKCALLALVAACAVLSASVATAASPAAAGPGKPTVTLNFLDITTNSTATLSQNRPPKLGDRFWGHDEFYKWNGTKRGAHVGHGTVTGVFLNNSFEISAVGYLSGGTIEVFGESLNRRTNTLAVIGGTGVYATARGDITVRAIGNIETSNKNAITIRLWM